MMMIFLAIETTSYAFMRIVEKSCQGADLIRYDKDFFCRNLKPLSFPETFRMRQKYDRLGKKSFQEMGKDGPFDVIVFGDSSGISGWPEILRDQYELRIVNVTSYRHQDEYPDAFLNVMRNYYELNQDHPAILLWTTITERGKKYTLPRSLWSVLYDKPKWQFDFSFLPSIKLMNYLRYKIYRSDYVEVIQLGKHRQMFLSWDIKGVAQTPAGQDVLTEQFKEAKAIAQEKGCRLGFVFIPTKVQLYPWLLKDKIKNWDYEVRGLPYLMEAARKADIPVLDISKELLATAKEVYEKKGELLWFPDDSHMNLEGASYVAEAVYPFIQEIRRKPLPPQNE